jgi:hypothetical protein
MLLGTDREERGNPVKVSLLAILEDLLVAGLDFLEADWPASHSLTEKMGERLPVLLGRDVFSSM